MSQDREFADTVAIIGMSCRFAPNLNSPDKFWTFLAEGGSSVSEMPEKRWAPYVSSSPQATAIMRQTTRLGSFMEDIEGFDADFFGISPREADFLDPQQRIMLELAWEALVNAGVPPLSLRGSDAGVYVAANSNDYGRRLLEDIPLTGAYAVNGTTYYGIANRVSYFLDLRGPSMAVDTACAGSLTAMHLACQALRAGETPMAVVGGVNIMSTPALFVALDAAGATAPDGRSKAFDKHADGYGRGEGAGVVVLKRATDARRDGDPILALVLGSGVFQDGRSDGMMAPNSSAQENMLRQTYDRTGISPDTVGYVEAHGTGTPVGDREEVRALARVFGQGRPPGDTCLIGSVKPNIGHTEGGSGIAGVIKTVLALRHEQLPPSLHTEPNPDLDWNHSGLSLVGALSPWPAHGQPRRAGVSSYGVGGTIAHLILQEAPQPPAPRREAVTAPHTTTAGRPTVFPVSAMSEAGLRATAGTVADWLADNPDVSLASVGHTLARRRSHLSQRAAVIASTADELTAGLRAVADGRRTPSVATGRALSGKAADVVWVFSGHGAQWLGMGRQLLRQEPSFAQVIDALEDVYRAEMGWTPREAIVQGGPWTASQAQAMTYAMQVGLMAVWRRHGVAPRAVIGHSVGEIAAAVAAGSLDLIEAARFACRRAVALRRIEGLGAMVLARLSFQEAQKRLAGRQDVVAAIAASMGSAVISGDREAVQHIAAQWQQEGIELWHVDTDIAFHSPHIDAAIQDVTAAAAEMTPRPPLVDLYTTTLADPRSTAPRDSSYWADNLRRPVRFADAVQAAHDDGYRVFAEVSSHPVVTHSITETLDHLGAEDAVVVPTLRRNADEVGTFLASLAGIHCHGAAVEWSREHAGGELVPLPAAAWQHRPYWIFPPVSGGAELGSGHDPDSHTLLGGRMSISGAPARKVWQTFLDMSCRPYPQSHEVVGVEITPAAAIVSTFVAAAKRDGEIPALSDIVLRTPLAVTPPRVVQVVLAENTIRLASRIASDEAPSDDEEDEWITHTTAAIDWTAAAPTGTVDVAGIRARCDDEWDWSRVDDLFRGKGVGGYAFPWDLDELRRNDDEQLSILTLVPPPATRSGSWAHVIDGALTISAVLVTPEDAHRLWMSSQMGSVVFRGEPPARITVHTRRSANSPRDTVDVLVAGDDGQVVCAVTGLRFAPLQDQRRAQATPRDLVHEVVWRPVRPDAADGAPVRSVIIVGAEQHGRLGELLGDAGIRYVHVDSHEDLAAVPLSGHDAVIVTPARMTAGESPEQAAERCAWELVSTAQQVSAAAAATYNTVYGAPAMPKVWCLTRGVREARDEPALAHAPLWGIGRIIAGERPDIWGGVIDLGEPELNAPAARRLLLLLRHAGGEEDIFSLTDTGTAVARLTATERPAEGPALQCRATGTYLITGGLGGIGLTVAHWLVDRGARRLLLLSRRGLPPRTEWDQVTDPVVQRQIQGVLELEALGVTVRVLAVDISDADQVAAALDPSAHGLPPVRGIIHAAGVVEDAMLDNVDRQSLRNVLGPKTSGAMVLHRLFPPGTLDFLVLFSSCGQFARLTGQLSYAAGNSFLDALAAHRHGTGHTETASLAWTSWQGVGMAAGPGTTMLEANSRGLDEISVAEAFRAWSFADRFRVPYQAILRVLPLPAHTPRLPMFRELTATDVTPEDTGGQGFLIDATGLSDQELRELVTDDVRQQVAAELNLADEEVEIRRPLVELGVDSVLTVALRVRLNRRFGLDLPPTILWSQPTVSALGGYIAESVRARAEAAEETAFDQDEPIAA